MTTADDIRIVREAREAAAATIVATLPPGDYYAFDNAVMQRGSRVPVVTCDTHWDACLIMLAIGRRT